MQKKGTTAMANMPTFMTGTVGKSSGDAVCVVVVNVTVFEAPSNP